MKQENSSFPLTRISGDVAQLRNVPVEFIQLMLEVFSQLRFPIRGGL